MPIAMPPLEIINPLGVDLPPSNPPISPNATPAPFPVRTKQAVAMMNGTRTDVTSMKFADKIMITVSQDGRLGHWVHVPLESADPTLTDRRPVHHSSASTYGDEVPEPGSELLPLPHLTATTILGAGAPERDTFGQLLATQIASAITVSQPDEKRLLVLGMGLKKDVVGLESEDEMRTFRELVGLCVGVL